MEFIECCIDGFKYKHVGVELSVVDGLSSTDGPHRRICGMAGKVNNLAVFYNFKYSYY